MEKEYKTWEELKEDIEKYMSVGDLVKYNNELKTIDAIGIVNYKDPRSKELTEEEQVKEGFFMAVITGELHVLSFKNIKRHFEEGTRVNFTRTRNKNLEVFN